MNDVAELVDLDQPALGVDRELERLARRRRFLADLAGGHLQVLLADGVDDVLGAEPEGGHLVRIEPDAHAVVAAADVGDVGDAGQAAQLVLDLDGGVVAQIDVVVHRLARGRVGLRDEVDHHHRAGRLLLHADALPLDQVGNDRLGQRDAILHEHLGHVGIHAQA